MVDPVHDTTTLSIHCQWLRLFQRREPLRWAGVSHSQQRLGKPESEATILKIVAHHWQRRLTRHNTLSHQITSQVIEADPSSYTMAVGDTDTNTMYALRRGVMYLFDSTGDGDGKLVPLGNMPAVSNYSSGGIGQAYT